MHLHICALGEQLLSQNNPDINLNMKSRRVNLNPSLENYLPIELDSIRDREMDIKFNIRTKYDEQVAHIVTDYIKFTKVGNGDCTCLR
jgi:hypothetical protein